MEDKKTEETKNPQPQPKMREVIIQTDGTNINLAKDETSGRLELVALLSTLLNKLQQR